VGTHQPFDADARMTEKYGSRKIAAVAELDQTLEKFMTDLRQARVLDDTLVIFTSDESHGAEGADWYSSWGFAMVLAPEQKQLPRMKRGTYGLVDIQVSILDYLGLPLPPDVIGRSLFREYAQSRDMISFTSGKLRWQTVDHTLYECTKDNACQVRKNAGIVGMRKESKFADDAAATRVIAMARAIDTKLARTDDRMVFNFASGEIRAVPEKVANEWTDNLIGAQYLSFPENSHVLVDIQLTAVTSGASGIQPKLTLRQWEKEVLTIPYSPFPSLQQGESCRLQFDFENKIPRKSFSFHLTAEGSKATLQINKFEVVVEKKP
jgi:hypothetical protein